MSLRLANQSWRRRAGLLALPLTLSGLAGCSDLAVRLGLRTRLDKLPVTSITASLVGKTGPAVTALAPGASAGLVIVATTQDGKQLVSAGPGHGKVLLDSFVFTPSVVQLGKRGKVSMPTDPRVSDGKVGSIHITTVGHPDVVTDLDIAARYDVAFVADFNGAAGMDGSNGSDGLDGMAGSDAMPGTPDPTTGMPGPQGSGGNGGNGSNGGDGGNGWDGAAGSSVHVWLRLKPGSDHILQAKVASATRTTLYLIDGHGGSLKVSANGGPGGAGGRGGRGGHGGSGGSGDPSGSSGMDGMDGSDGMPGSGGAAGSITVSVDPSAQSLLSVLSLSNQSGSGRPGAAPTFTVEAVPALW